jgi:molybdopterin-guanine dinucleotide biosynthesis protein
MRVISITGTASGVGKTTIAQFLLQHVEDFSALKITTKHEGNCPRHSDCDVCETMTRPYTITVDPLQINQPGKDTSLFKNAGARKVVWLQTHAEYLKEGIDEALSYFDKNDSVIVEGNSFLHTHTADVNILVTTPRETKIKRSVKQIIQKIDLAVINKYADDDEAAVAKTRERLHHIGCYACVHTVCPHQPDSISNEAFLDHVKEMIGHAVQS